MNKDRMCVVTCVAKGYQEVVGEGHSRVLVNPGDQVEVHYRVSNYS